MDLSPDQIIEQEGQEVEEQTCSICLRVPVCPFVVDNANPAAGEPYPCNHMFCQACGQKWIRQHKTCPVCRRLVASDRDLRADIRAKRRIEGWKVKCIHDGCPWTGSVGFDGLNWYAHVERCEHRPPMEAEEKPFEVEADDMEEDDAEDQEENQEDEGLDDDNEDEDEDDDDDEIVAVVAAPPPRAEAAAAAAAPLSRHPSILRRDEITGIRSSHFRQTVRQFLPPDYRISTSALDVLRGVTEAISVDMFRSAYASTMNRGGILTNLQDLRFAAVLHDLS